MSTDESETGRVQEPAEAHLTNWDGWHDGPRSDCPICNAPEQS